MVVVGGPDAFEALSRAPPSRADAAEGFRAEGEAGPREPFFFFFGRRRSGSLRVVRRARHRRGERAASGGCGFVKRDERRVHLVSVRRQVLRVERAHGHVSRRGVRHGGDRGVGVGGDERHELAAFASRPAEEQNLLVAGGPPRVRGQKPAGAHLQPSRRGVPRALYFQRRRGGGDTRVDAAVLRVQSRDQRAVHAARQSSHPVLSVVVAGGDLAVTSARALQPVQLLHHAPRDRQAHARGVAVGTVVRAEAVQQHGQALVAAAHERVRVRHDGQLARPREHRRFRRARGLARRRRNLRRHRRERPGVGREGRRERAPRPRARLGARPRPHPGPRPGPRAVALGIVFPSVATRGGERAQRLAHHFGVHLHGVSRVVPRRPVVLGGILVPSPVDVHRVVHHLPGAGSNDETRSGHSVVARLLFCTCLLFPESAPVAERDAAQSTVHDSTMSPNLAVQQPVKLRENARLIKGRFFPRLRGDNFWNLRAGNDGLERDARPRPKGPQNRWSATRRVR